MSKFFSRLEGGANRLGIWWIVLGPGGVLATIYGVIGSFFAPLAQYGWAAVALSAISLALVTLLVMSAVLIAWRIFRPLQPALSLSLSHREETRALDSVPPISTPQLRQDLERRIQDVGDRLEKRCAEVERRTAFPLGLGASIGEALNKAEDARLSQISRIREEVERVSKTHGAVHHDLLYLLDWAVNRATVGIISQLLVERPSAELLAPPNEDDLRKALVNDLDSWVRKVGSASFNLAYGGEIQRQIAQTTHDGEAQVRLIPAERRPSQIDALVFHDFYVTAFRCQAVGEYLSYVIREIRRNEAGSLDRLRECLNNRSRR